jgi:hypothetical protein
VTAVYQRDCVALYGSNSRYPSAAVTLTLGETGDAPARLVLTGLDDEWGGEVPITVAVNGAIVYKGSSGFTSWDPGAETVGWSQIVLTIDADLLVVGENRIVVTNQADAANFGVPPYILLAEASLTITQESER